MAAEQEGRLPEEAGVEAACRELLSELAAVGRTGASRGVALLGPSDGFAAGLFARLETRLSGGELGLLAPIPPWTGGEGGFFRHVLRHLVGSLERPRAPGGRVPLRELFASFAVRRILGRTGRVEAGPRVQREILEGGRALLRREAPGADADVLAALSGLFRGLAGPACEWLRGAERVPPALAGLGLAGPIASEERALAAIEALSALAWLGGRGVVVWLGRGEVRAGGAPGALGGRGFAAKAEALARARGTLVVASAPPAWAGGERWRSLACVETRTSLEPERFSVTQLRNAAACARLAWFDARRVRAGRRAAWLRRGESRQRGRPGRLFRRLVETILGEAPGDVELQRRMAGGDPAAALAGWLGELRGGAAAPCGEAARVRGGVEGLCALLGRLISAAGGAPAQALERVVPGRGEPLAWTFEPPESDRPVRLEGAPGAVLLDPDQKRLFLADLSGPGAGEAPEERLEAAAYTLLLERMSGLAVRPVLARFEGGLVLEELAAECAAALGESIPQRLFEMARFADYRPGAGDPPPASPGLCPVCPWERVCEQALGPRGSGAQAAPREEDEEEGDLPPWRSAEAEAEGQAALGGAVSALAVLGLEVEPLGVEAGPSFLRLRLKPAPGVDVAAIRNRAEALQAALGLARPPRVSREAGWIALEVARSARLAVRLEDVLAREEAERQSAFPLGVGADGRVYWVDLADPCTGHLLVAGGAGSGKSGFLRSLLAALAAAGAPEFLRFSLVAPEPTVFADLAGSPFLSGPVATRPEEVEDLLAGLAAEVEERAALMRRMGVSGLEALARRTPSQAPPRRIVVFDEFSGFMREIGGRGSLESRLLRLGAMGRAAGIHLVMATRTLDRSVVTGPVKASLPARICFRVDSRRESLLVLDRPGAETLLGGGDLLARMAGRLLRVQGTYPHFTEGSKASPFLPEVL